MRLFLLLLTAILVSTLFALGPPMVTHHAAAANLSLKESVPAITNATVTNKEPLPINGNFQASNLSMTLTTDKSVYLTGETVNITVSTSSINTHISVKAQLPDGSQQEIGNFTTNYSRTLSWIATSTPGQIRFTCQGDAIVDVWDYCTTWICPEPDLECYWNYYPCYRSITITGNASNDIRVFGRTTSISGHIIDTNQQPVPGASVNILGTAQSTTSNNEGYYEFSSYQLGNNYTLVNQIPTVTDTLSVEALACETQSGKIVQIQAERPASEINFTLKRAFYPPDIDLSEFTLAAFSSWPEAEVYSTWQNIIGITVDGPVQPIKWQYGNKEISPQMFRVGNKKLYLITKPELGRYFLDVQGTPNTQYKVATAATLNSSYLQSISVNAAVESNGSQRIRLTLDPNQIQLQVIKPFPILLIIIPIVLGILGGLIAAYFLTGGKMRWGKLSTGRKPPETELVKAKQIVKVKAIEKPPVKRPARRRIKGK